MPSQNKENTLVQRLASDNSNERAKGLEEVESSLKDSNITEAKYKKIWKSLCQGVKQVSGVKAQIDLCNKIARLIHTVELTSEENCTKWAKAFLDTIKEEQINHSRFVNLLRFCLIEIYIHLENKKWKPRLLSVWNDALWEFLFVAVKEKNKNNAGLMTIQIFVEVLLELDNIAYKVLQDLLEPFLNLIFAVEEYTVLEKIRDNVFRFFLKNVQEGLFVHFDSKKYSQHLNKFLNSKDMEDENREILEEIFDIYESPESPTDSGSEEIEEDAIVVESPKKSNKAVNRKRKQNELDEDQEKSPSKKGKSASKDKKAAKKEKNTKNNNKKVKKVTYEEETIEEEEKSRKKTIITKKQSIKQTVKVVPEEEYEDEEDDEGEDSVDDSEEDIDDSVEINQDDEDIEELDEMLQQQGHLGNLPNYLFITPAEQKKYFEKLNKEYFKNLQKANEMTRDHTRKIDWHLHRIAVKEFDKKQKVSTEKHRTPTESPNKGILKPSPAKDLAKNNKSKKRIRF